MTNTLTLGSGVYIDPGVLVQIPIGGRAWLGLEGRYTAFVGGFSDSNGALSLLGSVIFRL